LRAAFPKDHGVAQGEIVENERLSAALDFITAQQRERTEAKLARPSTTQRDTRLLRNRPLLWPVLRTAGYTVAIALVFVFLRPINQFIYFQF
jgi:hypothetical protein